MIELRKTAEFLRWIDHLRDRVAHARIMSRFERLAQGIYGDHKHVGEGVFELRIHHGPGYRVYCTQRGSTLIVILAGGDKDSQEEDIRIARQMARREHGG